MKNSLKAEISAILGFEPVIEKPKDKNLAHFATPVAFALAKERKIAPKIIAQELAQKFQNSQKFEATALNGYLNFKIRGEFLNELATAALNLGEKFGKNFAKENGKSERIFLEYISANPTGPLHIGHVRGAVYGDTFARIGNFLGHEVFTEYYINDAGNQIDLLGVSICLRAREMAGKSVEYPEKYYRGEYLDEIATLAKEKFGSEIFAPDKNGELADFGKDIVLEIIKKDLANIGIFIESWASERSFYSKLGATIERLKKSGQMYEKDGKFYIASTNLGDSEDRIVIRSDGRPTYLAGDIVYHGAKFAKNYDRYINIWGADHHGYIARIKAAVNFLGYDEGRLEIILMQMVSLLKDGKPFKMSKRAGNVVLMSDIFEEIGKDALRFIFISKANTTSLEFDIDALKKQDNSNPVFYINYAFARINQLFKKANKTPSDVAGADISGLSDEAKNLLFNALILPEILLDAFSGRQLHKITDYLKNLSGDFHKFYNENKIVGSADEGAFLKLFSVVALSIKISLNLMGIEPKERMDR